MYKNRIKPFGLSNDFPEENILERPCRCLGSRIADQMYNGVDQSNSTLLTGQYDDDDSWDVDPACDMKTDRFDLDIKEHVPVSQPTALDE